MPVRHIETEYGTIHRSDECKDDFGNIEVYDQPPKGGAPILLQRPALRSFRECEQAFARRTRPWWSKARKEEGRPIVLTGSQRSCEIQARLYASDKTRYAPPNVGVHTQALAIDVHTSWLGISDGIIRRLLLSHGWNQSRPDDEPWHFSFGVTA